MKRCLFLIASLCLTLVVFPAVAGESSEAAPQSDQALVAQTPAEPAAEEAVTAPQEEASFGFLSEPSFLSSGPQSLNSCTFLQCRQYCKASCSPGCICVGSCINDVCECTETCF